MDSVSWNIFFASVANIGSYLPVVLRSDLYICSTRRNALLGEMGVGKVISNLKSFTKSQTVEALATIYSFIH